MVFCKIIAVVVVVIVIVAVVVVDWSARRRLLYLWVSKPLGMLKKGLDNTTPLPLDFLVRPSVKLHIDTRILNIASRSIPALNSAVFHALLLTVPRQAVDIVAAGVIQFWP